MSLAHLLQDVLHEADGFFGGFGIIELRDTHALLDAEAHRLLVLGL